MRIRVMRLVLHVRIRIGLGRLKLRLWLMGELVLNLMRILLM